MMLWCIILNVANIILAQQQPPVESQCNPTICNKNPIGCSLNTDCECLQLTNGRGGMCADALMQCSVLKPCKNDNVTCSDPDTICIQNSRCNNQQPLCYPVALASPEVCPPSKFSLSNHQFDLIGSSV
ncbi:unnamed protein product [Didymodactylos carnosus]|uniref:Uncharacterized protein n=1 Tax=Didymodactylos carnosus TaxID=1234261 RepID=A0A8S2FHZ9_9BILA|nr:unnamed protein product [Didymodactylos carnosus]CAF4265319.1 unnamed protein product [Didymodactylos carnosus]